MVVWYLALGVLLLFLKPGRLGWLWSWVKDRAGELTRHPMDPAKTLPVIMGAVIMTAAAVALWWQVGTGGDGDLHVYFFDVGQGDSLDLVVMTHLGADHSRGLIDVLDRNEVGAILAGAESPASSMYAQWQAGVERNNVDVVSVLQGYSLDLGSGVVAEVLNPRPGIPVGESANNSALVLRITYGSVSFILTADIKAETESFLALMGAGIESTVLKVAHHGSKTSSTGEFIDAVDPEVVVISVGANNSFGHPNAEVVGRLMQQTGSENIYRTDRQGNVEFITDGVELWVETQR